jgi:hypothetical protein
MSDDSFCWRELERRWRRKTLTSQTRRQRTSRRIVHLRSKMKNEMIRKDVWCDEKWDEKRDKKWDEKWDEKWDDVLFEDKALNAIVDLTSSFLVRVISIFSDTKDDHETRKMKCWLILHSSRDANHFWFFEFEIKFVWVWFSSIQ